MDNLSIRPAVQRNAAFVVPLIIEAIGNIVYRLTGKQEKKQARLLHERTGFRVVEF
ncbi:hypothetical protein [Domibacillus robiginosus]|uniref:hypothetical protein n=1 Tax=Domibacillus robiginosus TaxID=1071054 RepID=UPI000AD51FAC|nr:hypothetical protein [Domibacillus robiginosus]